MNGVLVAGTQRSLVVVAPFVVVVLLLPAAPAEPAVDFAPSI